MGRAVHVVRCIIAVLAALVAPSSVVHGVDVLPRTGREAEYQRALELGSRLSVLHVSLRPGSEDFAALAYLRFARGARVTSAYLTNGEAGESDHEGLLPNYLAATRREEAAWAMAKLGIDAYFLNFPDVVAARDSIKLRSFWPADSVQPALMRLISILQPDLVLVAGTDEDGDGPFHRVLRSDVLTAATRIASPSPQNMQPDIEPLQRWSVDRIAFEDHTVGSTVSLPVDSLHVIWKKSFRWPGEEARSQYASMKVRHSIAPSGRSTYSIVYPRPAPRLKSVDDKLPGQVAPQLRSISARVENLSTAVLRGNRTVGKPGGKREPVVAEATSLMDSVDLLLLSSRTGSPERRTLLQWKGGLEGLRNALLKVDISYSVTESIVTQRQRTDVIIDTVYGLSKGGSTQVYFPLYSSGWIINEDIVEKLALEFGEPYRLISPQSVTYTYPLAEWGLERPTVGEKVPFFIIHRGEPRERTFVLKVEMPFHFAPRFTTEVLTPLVRATPGERVIVRLTNHTRDGVSDAAGVSDPAVQARGNLFRLNEKGDTFVDTLHLEWKANLDEGDHLFPIDIGGVKVANFGARKFEALVDTAKRVGLVTGIAGSPTAGTLRRLGVRFETVGKSQPVTNLSSRVDVIIVDRRAYTLRADTADITRELHSLVRKGGHVVVLAQDPTAWNRAPLIDGLTLSTDPTADEDLAVRLDSVHRMVTGPNRITGDDFNGWLYRRAHNRLVVGNPDGLAIPVATDDGRPLVVMKRLDDGMLTYVDLALQPQWLNIHPGAFRILGNLISL